MTAAIILKVFSDCCICFAMLGTCPAVLPYSYGLMLPSLICALSAGAANFIGEKWSSKISRFCGLLPLLCLLLAKEPAEMLILIVPVAYTAGVILRGKLGLDYYSYSTFFKNSLILLGALYIGITVVQFLDLNEADEARRVIPEAILRYGIVHLICGVMLQRQLRLGLEKRSEGNGGQVGALIAVGGAIGFGFVFVEPLMKGGATLFATYIMPIIVAPLVFVTDAISRLIMTMQREMWEEAERSESDIVEPTFFQKLQELINSQNPEQGEKTDLMFVWGIVIILFLTVAVVLMYLTYRKHRRTAPGSQTVEKVKRRTHGKRESRLSNRGKVRQLYREFLHREKLHGMKLQKQDTTADILRKVTNQTSVQPASQLRQVYLQARYDHSREVSRTQVEEAKQALKKCSP